MNLVAINVSSGSQLKIDQRITRTGIFKTGVPAAEIGQLGLPDDVVANQKHHGGPDQAIYVYSAEDYAWWAGQLGRALAPGSFGDNLTLSSFGSDDVQVGDRYRIGAVEIEVTAPRIPCSTLAAHMGDPTFIDRFRAAERPGFYARVLTPDVAHTGDPVRVQARQSGVTLNALFRLWYNPHPDPKELEHALAAPIAVRMRARYENLLAALNA